MKLAKIAFLNLISVILSAQISHASDRPVLGKKIPTSRQYRELTTNIRSSAEFMMPIPGSKASISYEFEFDQAVYNLPILSDTHLGTKGVYFFRSFWDRVLLKDGSYLEVNGERLPLTCVFIDGQDNRFGSKDLSPLMPEFVIRVYLVANDYSCQGPIRKGWPAIGGKKESWDTYLYYEIKDPTIMLPVDAKIRYRWNEFNVVLVDRGA